MADQGRWFKLWYTALQDTELVSLGVAGFGRWCMLGAYTKTHGSHGTVTINQADKVFLAMLDLTSETIVSELQKMPHLNVTKCNGKITVTFTHWSQYQEDHTVRDRVKRHRERVCNGDKRRGDKRRSIPKKMSEVQDTRFDQFWDLYPKRKNKGGAMKAWIRINPDEQKFKLMIKAVDNAIQDPQWNRDDGKWIPYPATWLNAEGWLDEYKVKVQKRIIT